jgi:hypothetical protein
MGYESSAVRGFLPNRTFSKHAHTVSNAVTRDDIMFKWCLSNDSSITCKPRASRALLSRKTWTGLRDVDLLRMHNPRPWRTGSKHHPSEGIRTSRRAHTVEETCWRLLPARPSDMDKTGLVLFDAKAWARAEALLFAAAASSQACFAAQIPHHDHLHPLCPPPTTHNAVASLPKNRAGESHPTHSQLGPHTPQHPS